MWQPFPLGKPRAWSTRPIQPEFTVWRGFFVLAREAALLRTSSGEHQVGSKQQKYWDKSGGDHDICAAHGSEPPSSWFRHSELIEQQTCRPAVPRSRRTCGNFCRKFSVVRKSGAARIVRPSPHKDTKSDKERNQRPQLPHLFDDLPGQQVEICDQSDHADCDQHSWTDPHPTPSPLPVHGSASRAANP
jgi:hypothetical protein